MSKDLKNKAINIKGKAYVQVKDRVTYFNDNYPNGSIQTELVSEADGVVTIRAVITPDVDKPTRCFTGYSSADCNDERNIINRTAGIENCETSAVGRALGFMGIGIVDSIASVDEINKAEAVKSRISTGDVMQDYTNRVESGEESCPKCSSKMVIGKGGKPYCVKCYLKYKNSQNGNA